MEVWHGIGSGRFVPLSSELQRLAAHALALQTLEDAIQLVVQRWVEDGPEALDRRLRDLAPSGFDRSDLGQGAGRSMERDAGTDADAQGSARSGMSVLTRKTGNRAVL
jgi:hypothetical protein